MPIKVYKPTTNGRRNMTSLTYEEITTNKPEKSLTVRLSKTGGRNNQGVITTRHHGRYSYGRRLLGLQFRACTLPLNLPAPGRCPLSVIFRFSRELGF